MYYLYRHIRLDTNEVFYVGIGKVYHKNTKDWSKHFYRAYRKTKRSNYWNNIVNKTSYVVDILFESDDKNFIVEKEKEFIKLYGRKDLELGTLVNLTDGGEGGFNVVHNKERRENHSKLLSGKNHFNYNKNLSEETKKNISKGLKNFKDNLPKNWGEHCKGSKNKSARRVKHIETNLEFGSLKEGCLFFDINYDSEQKRLKKDISTKSFVFLDKGHSHKKKCIHIETGKVFNSLKEGCVSTKENYGYQIKLIKNNKLNKKFEYINN